MNARRTWLGILAVAVATFLTSAVGGDEPAPASDPHSESVALFSEHCASCHVPPDPGFAVDRIWLDQIERTA